MRKIMIAAATSFALAAATTSMTATAFAHGGGFGGGGHFGGGRVGGLAAGIFPRSAADVSPADGLATSAAVLIMAASDVSAAVLVLGARLDTGDSMATTAMATTAVTFSRRQVTCGPATEIAPPASFNKT